MAEQVAEVLFVLDPDLDRGILREISVVARKDGNSEIATTHARWQNYAEKHNLLGGNGKNPDQV